MKLGVNLAYMASADQFQEQLRTAIAAEKYGYDSVWVAEAYGSDAATPLAYIAAQTEKIRLGSAIFQIPGRTPANCAMVSATLDILSGGRFILGIGSSGPQVAEGWHGQPFAKQIKRTREYVTIVRKALARERLEFDGELYTLPLPDGPGKALKLMIAPVQERIPIFLAAIGPNNTALAGEIADGWLPYLFSPEYLKNFTVSLEEGAARAGRTLDEIEISPTVFTAVGDDIDACRAMIKPILALYVGGMGSREKNFYNRVVQSYGFVDQAKEIQDLYLGGKQAEAIAAVPDELVDLTSLVGSAEHLRDRMAAYREAGVDNLIIAPLAADEAGRDELLRTLAEFQ
jgi:F420-dependent oxidoreductase-like protein